MSIDTLQTLTHEQLIREVQTRITGRPATTTSNYIRLATVPPARIMPYPKGRTTLDAVARRRNRISFTPTPARRPIPVMTPTPGELTYADFLRTPDEAAAIA